MRVALYLLLLLALAAIPGSVFPQRGASPAKVDQYFTEHPGLAVWMDRLSLFDVYSAPWFAAIYLLLVISLFGCVLPRGRQFIRQLRDGKRTGLLRESANLTFHAALLGILLSVATGSLFGYHGQVILREGSSFTNALAQYDSFNGGRLFRATGLTPFNFELSDMQVTYSNTGANAGDATDYAAHVQVKQSDGSLTKATIAVNSPLSLGNASVFLIGHGYAPHLRFTDSKGNVVFDDSVVFLPRDKNFTSTGVLKLPDVDPELGFDAVFAPSAVVTKAMGPHSLFPSLMHPQIFTSAWQGDLGLNNGAAQNIYLLDKTHLTRIGKEELEPGESWVLPDHAGVLTFVGVDEFATFNINSDPGQDFALLFAVLGIGSLALMLRTRRVAG